VFPDLFVIKMAGRELVMEKNFAIKLTIRDFANAEAPKIDDNKI
jgi:hypothetical protein